MCPGVWRNWDRRDVARPQPRGAHMARTWSNETPRSRRALRSFLAQPQRRPCHRRSRWVQLSAYLRTEAHILNQVMPTLPRDVWLHVAVSTENTSDISRLGRTCRALLEVADSEILHRGVRLYTAKRIGLFSAYLSNNSSFRAPRVKDLSLLLPWSDEPVEPDDPQCYDSVANILCRCEAVEKLWLHCPLLDRDERIGTALAGLRNVKTLWLDRPHRVVHLVPFLASMKSSCTNIACQDSTEDMYYKPTIPASFAFVAFTQSLQTLRLVKPSFRFALITFPRVKSLTFVKWTKMDVAPVLHSFPNLQDLCFVDSSEPPIPDGDRKSTRLNSSHSGESRMPSSA